MSFHAFAAANDLIINRFVVGRITRCQTKAHPHKRNGAYFCDGNWGWVQNWELHAEPVFWKSSSASDEEIRKKYELRRKQYDAERAKKQRRAAEKAKWLLSQCELDRHAYLENKGFPEMLGNVLKREGQDPTLCVPMYHRAQLCGCQLISSIGEKKFLFGQRTSDAVFKISNGGDQVYMAEGYASALSLQAILATLKVRYTILVTFSAGNMKRLAVAQPSAILICDNDPNQTSQKVGEGSGCRFYLPEVCGDDINDEWKRLGLLKSSQRLRKFLISVK